MDAEAKYAAATAGDREAIIDWEKQANLDFNYEAIHHTLTKYRFPHYEFIREKLANKELLIKVNGDGETALHLAAKKGHFEVCEDLIGAARILDSRLHPTRLIDDFVWHPNRHKDTALHLALTNAHLHIAPLLVEVSPPRHGHDIKNHLGETPVYLAVKLGSVVVIHQMCYSWRGSLPLDGPHDSATALHTAIINLSKGSGDIFVISSLIQSRREDKMSYSGYEELFDKIDKNYDTVLSLSVRQLQLQAVETILAEDPAYKSGRVRKSKDLKYLLSVIPRKPEKEYTYMANLLIKSYEARKDIGHEDQTALHTAIIKREYNIKY